HVVTSAFHRVPEFADTVDAPIGHIHRVHGVRGVGVGQFGGGDTSARLGLVVGGRGDADAVLGEYGADRVDPETFPVGVDIVDEHRSRRSTSAAAKNALAVFKISFALRNSAFSLRSRRTSSRSAPLSGVETVGESFRSAVSIQFRSVAGAM